MKKILLFFMCMPVLLFAQQMYPTHWWSGMKETKLQLMLKEEGIGNVKTVTTTYPGITIKKVSAPQNKNYLFVDLVLSSTLKPGEVTFKLSGSGINKSVKYGIKARSKENGKTRVRGVTSKDFAYLLMPDRFANGDPSNDAFPSSYRDKTSDRNNKWARHGGDLKGVQDHLDYFRELGVTAIWFTPVTENDMPKMRENDSDMAGYHGYWFTEHYNVDKRFGGNDGYKTFIDAAHQKGLKIIQ